MKINIAAMVALFVSIALPAAADESAEALWAAARAGELSEIQAALDSGVAVDAKTPYGATALLFAVRSGRLEAARLLIDRGADVNVTDSFYGMSALATSADGGNAEMIALLLERGAEGADNAMRSAARRGDLSSLEVFLNHGGLKSVFLKTAARNAQRRGQTKVAELFERHGVRLASDAGPKKPDAERLARFEGLYRYQRGRELRLERTETGLAATSPEAPRIELRESSAGSFFDFARPQVTFTFQTRDDRVLGFMLREGGPPKLFRRMGERLPTPEQPESRIASLAREIDPASGNWPQFRGRGASGVVENQYPPTHWNVESGINVRWKTPIPGLAHASPIVWREKLFVTTAARRGGTADFRHGLYGDVDTAGDLVEHEWKIYCLDKRTGETLWELVAHAGVPRIDRHVKSTHNNSTPATDGRYLVSFFGSEGLYCHDLEGNLIWKKDLGVLDVGWFYDPSFQWGFGSSPIIYRDRVIVQCDVQRAPFIAAFSLADGSELWRTDRDEIPSWGSPTLIEGAGGAEIVTNGTRGIRGYDPETGEELWTLHGNSEVTAPTPIFAHDLIFVTSGYRPIQPIYAIRPGARGDISLAEGESQNQFIAWSTKRDGPYMPTPIVYGEHLYTCSNNGIVSCYAAETGERLNRARLAHMGGGYSGSPVAADGRIYFPSEDGEIFVIEAGPEMKLLAANSMGELVMTTPAISEGMIFIRTIHHVFGIGATPDSHTAALN